MSPRVNVAVVAVLAWGLPFAVLAQSAASNIAGFDRIHTDKINFNINNGDFTIPDAFSATRQGTDVTADRANGNAKTKILHADGHVIVHQNQPVANRGKATDLTQRPSTLTCDKLDVDGTRKLYTATGNMHFTQEGGRDATSDAAVLNDATHKLHMEGHVRVKNGEQTIAADVLDYDTQSGQLDGNGNVTITSPVESPPPIARPKRRKLPI
jgi:lipopolysaccharide assembly outer membrane protein LptD (OstA)